MLSWLLTFRPFSCIVLLRLCFQTLNVTVHDQTSSLNSTLTSSFLATLHLYYLLPRTFPASPLLFLSLPCLLYTFSPTPLLFPIFYLFLPIFILPSQFNSFPFFSFPFAVPWRCYCLGLGVILVIATLLFIVSKNQSTTCDIDVVVLVVVF